MLQRLLGNDLDWIASRTLSDPDVFHRLARPTRPWAGTGGNLSISWTLWGFAAESNPDRPRIGQG